MLSATYSLIFISLIASAFTVDVPSANVLPPYPAAHEIIPKDVSPADDILPPSEPANEILPPNESANHDIAPPSEDPENDISPTFDVRSSEESDSLSTSTSDSHSFGQPSNNLLSRQPFQPINVAPHPLAVESDDANAKTLKLIQEIDHEGNYQFEFETDNGIQASEQGSPKQLDNGEQAEQVTGGFSYTAPDGQVISMTYTADENGFHPVGDHIPTPPPIPEAILRALRYIESRQRTA